MVFKHTQHFSLLAVGLTLVGCGLVKSTSDERSSKAGGEGDSVAAYGDANQEQGFQLLHPELPEGEGIKTILVQIFRGPVDVPGFHEDCQVGQDKVHVAPETPDSVAIEPPQDLDHRPLDETSGTSSNLSLDSHEAQGPESFAVPPPEPRRGPVLVVKVPYGEGQTSLFKLPPGEYTIRLMAKDLRENVRYMGVGFASIKAEGIAELNITLKRVGVHCPNGGLVITYDIEGDGDIDTGDSDDGGDGPELFNVCEFLARQPAPSCPSLVREQVYCVAEPIGQFAGVVGPRTCSMAAARYALLEVLCKEKKIVPILQVKGVHCEPAPVLNRPPLPTEPVSSDEPSDASP